MWSIYEKIHIWTAVVDESEDDHRRKFSRLSNWKEEAWKNQGFNGVRTRDLREPVQFCTNWAMKPHTGSEDNLLRLFFLQSKL